MKSINKKIVAVGLYVAGILFGASNVYAVDPTVVTGGAVNVSQDYAELIGTITDPGDEVLVEVGAIYDIDTGTVFNDYNNTSHMGEVITNNIFVAASSLTCGTRYYYRAYAITADDEHIMGAEKVFRTADCNADDLVSHWDMEANEGAGGAGYDLFGSNTLTIEGDVATTTGVIGSLAAQFSLAGEHLTIPDNESLSTGGDTSFSISAWVRLDAKTGTQVFVSKYGGVAGEYAIYFEDAYDRFMFSTYDSVGGSSPVHADELGSPEIGRWYHIYAAHDARANTNTIIIDDEYEDVVTNVPHHADTEGPFVIGAFGSSPTYFANASIDDVRFSKTTPIPIASCHELYDEMTSENGPSQSYILTADLNCTDAGLVAENENTALASDDFVFGGGMGDQFTGILDGDGHSIEIEFYTPQNSSAALFISADGASVYDLTINGLVRVGNIGESLNDVGALFGSASNVTISNVDVNVTMTIVDTNIDNYSIGMLAGAIYASTVIDVETSGTLTVNNVSQEVGGVFGFSGCSSTITNATSTVIIEALDSDYVGGISGQDGCEGPGSVFTNVVYSGTISGRNTVGGLVGVMGGSEMTDSRVIADTTVSGDYGVGGAIGEIVYNSEVSTTYSEADVSGISRIGGFIGEFDGGYIDQSYALGDVTGSSYSVGGFVGEVDSDSVITNAYARGDVTTTGGTAGGFVGFNMGTVYFTYATGDVNGNGDENTDSIGGFAGYNGPDTIVSSFSTGLVTSASSTRVGGFVGFNDFHSVINSAWVMLSSAYAIGYESGSGESWSDLAAFDASNFDEDSADVFKDESYSLYSTAITIEEGHDAYFSSEVWDFDDVWNISADLNDGYPFFQFQEFDEEFEDTETDTPILYSPQDGDTYDEGSSIAISFELPEPLLSNSLQLAFIPEEGDPLVFDLRDAEDAVENTFTLPLSGGYDDVTEIIDTSVEEIPVGIYTVMLSYQDELGNPVATASAEDVTIEKERKSSRGGSVRSRVNSLESQGKVEDAQTLRSEFPQLFNGADASTSSFTRNLTLGDTGSDVRDLQRFLNSKGYIITSVGPGSPGNETERFGELTRTALIKFQQANNLQPAIGYFGPLTRALVASMSASTPAPTASESAIPARDLELGMSGDDVIKLQGYLIAQDLGPAARALKDNGVTGYFGELTKAAVIEFQQAKNITPTNGRVGPVTRGVMAR